jgi:hypothetical protein
VVRIGDARVAGVFFGWVAADELYGNNSKLRQWFNSG